MGEDRKCSSASLPPAFSMANYFISPLAYLKVILHASKFPYATVTGLLLGTQTAGVVTISDAVPLLHHWTDLSPMMEAGLQLVRSSSLPVSGRKS